MLLFSGVYGFMHPVKRLEALLQAFELADLQNCFVYFVGQISQHSPQALRDLAGDFRAAQRARAIIVGDGYTPFSYMLMAMHAADAAINLRFPTTGETSASVASLLGMGKPTIVSDVGWFAELPDDCVLKVATGHAEIDSLVRAMRALACDAAMRRRLAHAAREFSRARTWNNAAQQVLVFVEQVLSQPAVNRQPDPLRVDIGSNASAIP